MRIASNKDPACLLGIFYLKDDGGNNIPITKIKSGTLVQVYNLDNNAIRVSKVKGVTTVKYTGPIHHFNHSNFVQVLSAEAPMYVMGKNKKRPTIKKANELKTGISSFRYPILEHMISTEAGTNISIMKHSVTDVKHILSNDKSIIGYKVDVDGDFLVISIANKVSLFPLRKL